MDYFSFELHCIIIACLKFLNEIENIDLIRILQKYLLFYDTNWDQKTIFESIL